MLLKDLPSVLIISSLLSQAFAQTHTTCNPLLTKCNPDPALGSSFDWDFSTQGASDKFSVFGSGNKVSYDNEGVHFAIAQGGEAPTISSNFYIMFGKVDIVAKSAPGVGIVSAAVLISDNLDEIDWEWLGKDNNQVQTNYFSKGDVSVYNRGGFSDAANAQNEFHTYTIEWTASSIVWSINGQTVRVLNNPGTGYYPQTPMQIRVGSWSGGDPSNQPGTIEWAGGETDYSKGPFVFTMKSIAVQDYSTGKEYVYGDQSGSWNSIQSVDGAINSNADNAQVSPQQGSEPNQGSNANEKDGSSSSAPVEKEPVLSSTPAPAPEPQPTPEPTLTSIYSAPEVTPAPNGGSQTFDDGQYHPNTKYDDGMYKPELYGRAESTVAQSNGAGALSMNKGQAISALFLSFLTAFYF